HAGNPHFRDQRLPGPAMDARRRASEATIVSAAGPTAAVVPDPPRVARDRMRVSGPDGVGQDDSVRTIGSDMRCLVLGATGYVGGRLVPRLAAAGHEVRCLVRNPSKGEALERLDSVEAVLGDAMNPDAVRTAMDGVDVVYHLVHSMDRQDFGDADQAVAQNVT